MPEVKVNEAAVNAVRAFERIVKGDLSQTIAGLNQQGTILGDRSNWAGGLASQFQAEWPSTHKNLKAVEQALEELKQNVDRIHSEIITVGGGLR